MRKITLMVLVIFSSLFVNLGLANAAIVQNCADTTIMELAKRNDSHVFEPGFGADYKVCLENFNREYFVDSCSSGYTHALDIANKNNGNNVHVGAPGSGYSAKKLCLEYTGADKEIKDIGINICPPELDDNCIFLVSLAKESDSHVGNIGWGAEGNLVVELESKVPECTECTNWKNLGCGSCSCSNKEMCQECTETSPPGYTDEISNRCVPMEKCTGTPTVDRDDETTLKTDDTIKISAKVFDKDTYYRDKVYITIYDSNGNIAKETGGTPVDSKQMTCSDTGAQNWTCYYDYNPWDGTADSDLGLYDVKITAVDKAGLTDTVTKENLFEVKDIKVTNLAHSGHSSELHITGKAEYVQGGSVAYANIKCYSEKYPSYSCTTTADSNGNFDCNFDCGSGDLDGRFISANQVKTNTFICEAQDADNITGKGTHDIKIGLDVETHNWDSPTLKHNESSGFSVTFKNTGNLALASNDLYWEVSSKDGENPETDEDCHGTGWVDACGHLYDYSKNDPHKSCGCYKMFGESLTPGETTTVHGSWKAKYHEFGNYKFRVYVRFKSKTGAYLIQGESPTIITIEETPPTDLDVVFAKPSPVDRDAEAPNTYETVNVKVEATDYVDGVLGDKDELEQYATVSVKSDNGTTTTICSNKKMTQDKVISGTWGEHYHYTCSWNPPNDMSDSDLGPYAVKIKVKGWGVYNGALGDGTEVSGYSQNPKEFVVQDIDLENVGWPGGNTTDLTMQGHAKYISNGANVNSLINEKCGESELSDIVFGNENIKKDYDDSPFTTLRNCGVNSMDCSISNGDFNCYIKDIKITGKNMKISYILTDGNHISGSEDLTFNLDGSIDSMKIQDPDKFVNPYQTINYTINFSNTGNLGWYGKIFNQTRIRVYSPPSKNPAGKNHISIDYDNETSWVNLMNETSGNFSQFLGKSYYILGDYNYTARLKYFWPEYNNDYGYNPFNFTITQGSQTLYTVAAIDITDYDVPEKIIRGNKVDGKVKGYFVASMDLTFWEVVQAFKYRVTNKTTEGEYWITRINKTKISNKETPVYGSESSPKKMNWGATNNYWKAPIDTTKLECDDNTTHHRIYFKINWTDYNIYKPYVEGQYQQQYIPYFYQDFNVSCVVEEEFKITPKTANVPLGAENRNIFHIKIPNPSSKNVNVKVYLRARGYEEAINWVNFSSSTYDCGQGCIYTDTTLINNTGGSATVVLEEAPRVGNYEFKVEVEKISGEKLYTDTAWLNVFSEALGSDNIIYLLILFSVVFILLYKRRL